MFTGLVEGQGTVAAIFPLPAGLRLTIRPDQNSPVAPCFNASEANIGDSICISGCCLTVIRQTPDSLDFEAGLETLAKTNLGLLTVGSRVNLERSLQASARLGGHFVQGHVDGIAEVVDVRQNGDWTDLWFLPAPAQHRLLVPKGSVAVDGVSLTVVSTDDGLFSVALIPHTLAVTTLGQRRCGDRVNIENDVLGKYVDHLLESRLAGLSLPGLTSNSLPVASAPESPAPQ